MKTIPIKQITSWSFSRYSDYKQCPAKAKYKHVDKLKEPPNDAMARGAAIHAKAEDYIKGKIRAMPVELKLFADTFKFLKTQYKKSINGMCVEDNWSFTKTWTETQWNDWVNCAVRIKLDCAHHIDEDVMVISDWKTGKFRPEMNDEYIEQLELYALAALILHPHLKEVHPRLVYLDTGTIYPNPEEPLVFTQKDVPKLKKTWEKRTKPMLNDKSFAPRPNDKCKWCHFSKSKNGPCKY